MTLISQLDSESIITRNADLNYITQHNKSFLSGFLLSRYKRQLSTDTIEKYYALLSEDVKKSNVGYTVLEYTYPLSDNIAFKKANPLNGIEFNEKLASIKSIHDLISMDTLGNNIDFKSFKGNYVLIDFWASWCKPCIEDIPYLRKLVEEFKNDSIQFISVSVDTDGKKWKKAILNNNMNWLQASELTGFHGLVPTYCKIIVGVPQYVLVDKNGVIINSNTPRPDDPELKILLNNSLKK
jgi:thiol-disulfide isomerase/thioredoxin